jgi:uncharacterized RDD family membrane protein YckC
MAHCQYCMHQIGAAQFCSRCGKQKGHAATTDQSVQADCPMFAAAGFWLRAAALLIDATILGCVYLVLAPMFRPPLPRDYLDYSTTHFLANMAFAAGWAAMLYEVCAWLYFAACESSSFQATLGKYILGLRVCDIDCKALSFRRATLRYWSKALSTMTFGIGFMMAGWTHDKQALHDKIAGTLVVHAAPKSQAVQAQVLHSGEDNPSSVVS